jgi:hypothetical protein
MPIEIRELVIRASVSEGGEKPRSSGKKAKSDKDTMIESAVTEVFEIMKTKKQR